MTPTLLAISIGPVQDFIAAARRTRDLWFGSHMLSEISKAVANSLRSEEEHSAELIFPPMDADLASGSELVVANIVVARLPAGMNPDTVAAAARQAAQSCWLAFAREALGRVREKVAVRTSLWDEQVSDVIEVYAAWTPLGADYSESRRRVMRVLAGRKALRDFLPGVGHQGIPKSSLDGARESVLPKDLRRNWTLRLTASEQLDAIGVTKRVGGDPEKFPSVSRIAADTWLREAAGAESELFQKLLARVEPLVGKAAVTRVRHSAFRQFPYEGTAVYRHRYQEFARETELDLQEFVPLGDAVAALAGKLGNPGPYLATLVADGDRVGRVISKLASVEENQRFSRQLSLFAKRAGEIVEEEHGMCVFAGGDDVLAFLPLDTCLRAARRLHDAFSEQLGEWRAIETPPTLSVGLAIGHFMEPLEGLHLNGYAAEKLAKTKSDGHDLSDTEHGERDGLAIVVHPRGGAAFHVRERWGSGDEAFDVRLERWRQLFDQRKLPSKWPRDLHELARVYDHWQDQTQLGEVVAADVKRVLRRKQTSLSPVDTAWVAERVARISDARGLRRLADECLVAQRLAGGGDSEG